MLPSLELEAMNHSSSSSIPSTRTNSTEARNASPSHAPNAVQNEDWKEKRRVSPGNRIGMQDTLHITCPADRTVDRGDLCDIFFPFPGLKKLSFHEGYAFAFFENSQSAGKALEGLTEGKSHRLTVEFARVSYRPNYYHPDTVHPPNRRLHVTHFPRNTTVLELRRIFARYPGFESVEYHIKYAYILFKLESFATFALNDLNTRTNLIVSYAKAEKERDLSGMFDQFNLEGMGVYGGQLHQPSAAYPAPHQLLSAAAAQKDFRRRMSPSVDEFFANAERPQSWVPTEYSDLMASRSASAFEDAQQASLHALRLQLLRQDHDLYDDRFSDVSAGTYFNPPSPANGLEYLAPRQASPVHLLNRRPSPLYHEFHEMGSNPVSPNTRPLDVFGATYVKDSRPPSRVEDVVSQVDWKDQKGGWNPWSTNIFPEDVTSSKSVTPSVE